MYISYYGRFCHVSCHEFPALVTWCVPLHTLKPGNLLCSFRIPARYLSPALKPKGRPFRCQPLLSLTHLLFLSGGKVHRMVTTCVLSFWAPEWNGCIYEIQPILRTAAERYSSLKRCLLDDSAPLLRSRRWHWLTQVTATQKLVQVEKWTFSGSFQWH